MTNPIIGRTVAARNKDCPQWKNFCVLHVCYRGQAQANALFYQKVPLRPRMVHVFLQEANVMHLVLYCIL